MKRLYSGLLLVFIAILAFHCQKEISSNIGRPDTGLPVNTSSAAAIKATLQGNIVDENGAPAIGVAIKVGAKTATTNVRGYFRITSAGLDKNASVVTAEKAGYFTAYRSFRATSGVNQVSIKLIKKTITGTVNAVAGGSVALSNGSKITLPAKGIVRASGGTDYTGVINVYASYINPADPNIGETVPGSFMADDKDKKRVTLASLGMLAVQLESSSGEKLQIAPGSTATLITAIPSTLQAAAPATIPMWYVDEQTGIWKEEGSATKNGSTYTGEVKHFSYWNCDVPVPSVAFTATFKTSEGAPLAYTQVLFRPAAGGYFSSTAHGFTDSLGQVSGLIPSNMNLVLEVISYGPCYNNTIYSQNVGPFTSNTELGTITIPVASPSLVTLKGKLVNCNNAPVTNGNAIIYYDNYVRHVETNNNGEFSTTFTSCAASPATCEVTGVDRATQQQGPTVNVTITSPVSNAGTLKACGTSTLQFINYNLDGTDYTISNATTDSLYGYSYALQQPDVYTHLVSIMGYHVPSFNLSYDFKSNTTAGIYPVVRLRTEGYERIGLIAPFNVTLTSYPQSVGGYFEGSMSGQFRDSANLVPLHTISASFRLRKNY